MAIYNGEKAYYQEHGAYSGDLDSIGAAPQNDGRFAFSIVNVSASAFAARAMVLKPFRGVRQFDTAAIDQDGRKTASAEFAQHLRDWK